MVDFVGLYPMTFYSLNEVGTDYKGSINPVVKV